MSVMKASRKMSSREQTAYDLGFHEGRNAATNHGRWEKYARFVICSECDIGFCYYKNETDRFQYCPNCGAKMDLNGE